MTSRVDAEDDSGIAAAAHRHDAEVCEDELVAAGLAFVGVWIYFPLVFVLPVAVMVAWTFRLERAFLRHGYVTAPEPAPVARP